MTNTNPDRRQTQDQDSERREEQLLFQRFLNVATSKLEQISLQEQTSKQASANDGSNGFDFNAGFEQKQNMEMGEEEQKIISRITGMGLREGIFAAIASFVVLRRGPKIIGRWVQRRNQQRSSFSSDAFGGTSARNNTSYELSDPTKLINNNANNPFRNAANGNRHFPRPRGFLSRSIWFVFDTVLSVMVGANVSMVFTDKNAIRQEIAELPLVSGRSLVADTLCDEMVEELKKLKEEKNPTYQRLERINRENTTEPTAAAFYMSGVTLFCQNCERRRYLEKCIREETGLNKTSPVKIPFPGVPKDSPRLVVEKDGTEHIIDKDGIENSFQEQFGQGPSWSNDFLSDDYDGDQGRST